MKYYEQLCSAMNLLAESPQTIFMGQSVKYPGTGMFGTLKGVPQEKLLELPVMEDCQLGMAIGMSLEGFVPVCIYPRVNFLLLAINQLVNHLDKIPQYSKYSPKVIIRTAIATDQLLNPGPQHLGVYIGALMRMTSLVRVVRLEFADEILPQYELAMERGNSTILVEEMAQYG